MKHLRFTTLCFQTAFLIVLLSASSAGQSAQPAQQTPSLSPSSPSQTGDVSVPVNSQPASQAPASASNTASPQRRFKLVPPKNSPKLKMLPDAPLVPELSGQRLASLSGEAWDSFLNRSFFLASTSQLALQFSDGMHSARQRADRVLVEGSSSPERQSKQSVDPGIFLGTGNGNMCGSIVSYNFSPGDNPQLESVTTCTPADAIVTRRALGRDKKPLAPLFRTTELPTPQR